ncbi:Aste57867_3825 [Aphanomyces stellatus]|uniref:Aste57867_3825 protein n=1 Tax=Aphanomyces stellatus TaxID=120398 RepID=A0A485KEB7_9STRA|nr:hypothetical protein As57867_003814 [Aphanomyces stellatus]VFT80973.1 Aste57867_3825 [Aphanomyces stellatus]
MMHAFWVPDSNLPQAPFHASATHMTLSSPTASIAARRLERRRPILVDKTSHLDCGILATSVRRPHWLCRTHLVYHIRMCDGSRFWRLDVTHADVHALYDHLTSSIEDPEALRALMSCPCPRMPLFHRQHAFVIKGMASHMEHFLHNLLHVCRRWSRSGAPQALFAAHVVATFLRLPRRP